MISDFSNESKNILCDWISVSQDFDFDVPELSEGVVVACNSDMSKLEWKKVRAYMHPGSYDTNLLVKSENRRVFLSGNVGRFGRPDNVFGYSIDQTKVLCNRILSSLGLPEFTNGEFVETSRKCKKGELHVSISYSGANVSSVHLTENFQTGSKQDGENFLYWLESQKPGRADVTGYHGQTVYVGERSKYARRKIYNKAEAILHDLRRKLKRKTITREERDYLKQLAAWCESVGLIRHEVEFKSRYLSQHGLKAWELMTDKNVIPHYTKYKSEIMSRCDQYTEISELPAIARGIYYSYLAGEDLRDMPKTTRYRYRKMLLPLGIDILRPLNVKAINVKPRIIELRPVEMPEFYQMPTVA